MQRLMQQAKGKYLLTFTLVQSSAAKILTCFLCADGEFLTGLALAYSIVGVHADAVDGGRVKVHYVGLVVGGGDVSSGMLQLPGIWQKQVLVFPYNLSTGKMLRDVAFSQSISACSIVIQIKKRTLFTLISSCSAKLRTCFILTCLVLILYIIRSNDTVSIKSLCPPEIHTAIFHFSHLQLRRVWGL